MLTNSMEAVIFYMKNKLEIRSMVESNLDTLIKLLVPKDELKKFARPNYIFTCDSINLDNTGVIIGLTNINVNYKSKDMIGEVNFIENNISISLSNMYEYLSIVSNMIEIPESVFVNLIKFCCIHEAVHYIQAWTGILDKDMKTLDKDLFIVDEVDIREEPKNHDVYGRYIEIICINQCNKLFEDRVFGKDSDLYLLFSMVGLLSIELEGEEYEKRMTQIGEMLRDKYF